MKMLLHKRFLHFFKAAARSGSGGGNRLSMSLPHSCSFNIFSRSCCFNKFNGSGNNLSSLHQANLSRPFFLSIPLGSKFTTGVPEEKENKNSKENSEEQGKIGKMSPNAIFWTFFGFYTASFLWDLYLSLRQYRLYRRTERRPDHVAEIISEEEFTKARAYKLDTMHFGFFSETIARAITSAVLIFNGLPWIWKVSGTVARFIWPASGEIFQSIAFIGLTSIASELISLPFSLYSTFVIEERHGFNKQTLPFFFKDHAKKLVLTLALSAPIIAALIWIVQNGGPYFFFYVWCFLSFVTFLLMTIYPEFIAPLFDRYTPLPVSDLRTKIEALAARVEFPLKKLYVVEGSKRSSHSNAYMYGFWKNKRIVVFDTLLSEEMNQLLEQEREKEKAAKGQTGKTKEDKNAENDHQKQNEGTKNQQGQSTDENENLLETPSSSEAGVEKEEQQKEEENQAKPKAGEDEENGKDKKKKRLGLSDDEVVAVLGHELGHWSLSHTVWNLFIAEANLLLMFAVFAQCYRIPSLYAAFGFPASVHPTLIGLTIVFQFVMAPYNEFMGLAMSCLSRRMEFSADEYSARLGYSAPLQRGLVKLASDNLSLPIDDWLYSLVNHSHPPVPERIEALKKHQ